MSELLLSATAFKHLSLDLTQCITLHGFAAYCKALKVDPSLALLLDVALPQYSPWKPAAKTLLSFWRKELTTGAAQVKVSGQGPAEYRFTEKLTAPEGRLTEAQELGLT